MPFATCGESSRSVTGFWPLLRWLLRYGRVSGERKFGEAQYWGFARRARLCAGAGRNISPGSLGLCQRFSVRGASLRITRASAAVTTSALSVSASLPARVEELLLVHRSRVGFITNLTCRVGRAIATDAPLPPPTARPCHLDLRPPMRLLTTNGTPVVKGLHVF